MKITCTQENLHKALQMVGRAVGTRVNLPVLANILLKTEAGQLTLAATDLEIGLTTVIGAKVEEEGAVTVPSRMLVEFVNSVSDDTLELTTEGAVLYIKGTRTKATLRGIDAEEFPVIPEVSNTLSVAINGQAFLQGLKQVIIAAAVDEARPVLGGVYMKWQEKQLVCAATDSYRLAEKVIPLEFDVMEEKSAIVPARSITELIRVLSATNPGEVLVSLQENQILFAFDDTQLVSRLIYGKYPDYQKIIPNNYTTTAQVSADIFKNTLRSASIFARESANTSKVHLGPGNEIILSAIADQLGDATVSMPAEIDGEEAEGSFNIKFLSDGLVGISEKEVQFQLSGKYQPAALRGLGITDYQYIIMPLRID